MSVIVFDVNESLLDRQGLDPLFGDILGDAALRPQWFATVLQLSFVGWLTGQYVDFTTAQRAALRMTAARAGRSIATGVVETVVDAMRRLAPHPHVPPVDSPARSGHAIDRVDQFCSRRVIGTDMTEVADALLASDGNARRSM